MDWTRARVTYQKSWLSRNVTGLFGVLSVFGRRIKGMIRLRPEQVWTCNVTLLVRTCSGRDRIVPLMRRPNTDSTPNKPVTLPRNQLLMRYAGRVPSTLSRYGVTIRGNVTSVDPPLSGCVFSCTHTVSYISIFERTQRIQSCNDN